MDKEAVEHIINELRNFCGPRMALSLRLYLKDKQSTK